MAAGHRRDYGTRNATRLGGEPAIHSLANLVPALCSREVVRANGRYDLIDDMLPHASAVPLNESCSGLLYVIVV